MFPAVAFWWKLKRFLVCYVTHFALLPNRTDLRTDRARSQYNGTTRGLAFSRSTGWCRPQEVVERCRVKLVTSFYRAKIIIFLSL